MEEFFIVLDVNTADRLLCHVYYRYKMKKESRKWFCNYKLHIKSYHYSCVKMQTAVMVYNGKDRRKDKNKFTTKLMKHFIKDPREYL